MSLLGVVGVSAVPFVHAVADGPAVTGFPAFDGVLAVAIASLLILVSLLWEYRISYLRIQEYRTIGYWIKASIYQTIGYRTQKKLYIGCPPLTLLHMIQRESIRIIGQIVFVLPN